MCVPDGPTGASSNDLLVILREHGVVDILMSVELTSIVVSVAFRPHALSVLPASYTYNARYYLESVTQYDLWRYCADLVAWWLLTYEVI